MKKRYSTHKCSGYRKMFQALFLCVQILQLMLKNHSLLSPLVVESTLTLTSGTNFRNNFFTHERYLKDLQTPEED